MSESDMSDFDESLDPQFDKIFSSQMPAEDFAKFLATSQRRKFTVLIKAIEGAAAMSSQQDNRAFNILKAVLHLTVHNHQISSDELSDLTSCVFTETKHFSSVVLSNIVTHCLEYMKSHQDSDISTRWIELFGKVVAILSNRIDIPYDGDEIEGKDFRTAVVNELCRLNWGARNAPYLISAIREFPGLGSTEIDAIIHKVTESIKVLEPSSVPPIAYQLLILATERTPKVLVQTFDEYFKGMTLDNVGNISLEMQAKRNALGTVVYHFIHAARHSSILIKEIIKRIKNSCDDHSLLMTPFIMSLSLGLTNIDHIKSQVMDILRRSIVNSLNDARNCDENVWYRDVRGEKTDTVMGCFKSVIDSKSSELDFLLDGLKDVGLVLLNIDNVPTETHCADRCRELGSFIIEAIVKKKSYYFPRVMNELLKTKSSVHINCLANCLRSLIRTIVQSNMSGRINELIHHLPLMTVETATPVIKSLIPAFQLSRNLLDEMIMVVRKTIWKSIEARKISVQAMVMLLSNSRIVGQIPRSQYSDSQTVMLSQASQVTVMPTTNENECLCYELLSILKRFFTQNSEVRERLYLGLNVVSRKNPELIGVICSHLLSQVKQYMDYTCTTIEMKPLLDFSSPHMAATEDLGLLLQSLSFVALRGRRIYKVDSENQPNNLVSCEQLLNTWIGILSEIKLEEIEISASSALGSLSSRSLESVRDVRNVLILLILQTIEALMEYLALRRDGRDDRKLLQLFKKLVQFEPCLAPPPKPTKKDKKDKDKSTTTRTRGNDKNKKKKNSSRSDATTSQGAQELTVSKGKSKKEEPAKILVLIHIINLDSIQEILRMLYSPPSSDDVLRQVRKQTHFERFILSVIKQKIERLKKHEPLRERDRKNEEILSTLADIAATLWEVSLRKANDTESMMETEDEDDVQVIQPETVLPVATYRFEIIMDLVEFLNNSSLSFPVFLKIFNSDCYEDNDKTLEERFQEFFNVWTTIVNKCTDEGDNTKGLEHLFTLLDSFCQCLTPDATGTVKMVLDWCVAYAKNPKDNAVPTIEVCGLVIQTILTVGSKLVGVPEEIFFRLAKQCHRVLGDVDDDTQAVSDVDEVYWLINQETAPIVITTIGLYVERCLALVTIIIKRLRVRSQYFDVETLSDLRDNACVRLIFLINLSTELIRSCFPPGPCVDILQRLLAQVFITTTLLTEHLIEIHSKKEHVEFTAKKFSNLVKLIGKDFKIRVEGLINHIEGIQREEADEFTKTNKKGAKVPAAMRQKLLKDAKTIPAMVYNVEKYEQQLILLCQKTDVNLLAGTKLSTARDFRIEMTKLKALADTTEEKSIKRKKMKNNKRTRDASPESEDSDTRSSYDGNNSSI